MAICSNCSCIYMALNRSAVQLLLRFGFSFALSTQIRRMFFRCSYAGVHNLSSPLSIGLKKRLVSFPSPAPQHTITHSHTLLYAAWPCIFLNLCQLSSLRVQILVAASQLQSGWAVAVFLNLQIWLVLLQLHCGDRVGSVCICMYVCVCLCGQSGQCAGSAD